MTKVTREVRLPLHVVVRRDDGAIRHERPLLATELVDALTRLVVTLPPDARVQPLTQNDSRWCVTGVPCTLAFNWEEDLPAADEVS